MKNEELEVIGKYVKSHIGHWLQEARVIPTESHSHSSALSERIIRVEEAIKHQVVFGLALTHLPCF